MIYLASPYHSEYTAKRHHRVTMASICTAYFLRKGECVYSPIVHNHQLAIEHDLPKKWSFWRNLDLNMLRRAEALWILMLPGWTTSKGVLAELQFAKKIGLTVKYVRPSFFDKGDNVEFIIQDNIDGCKDD